MNKKALKVDMHKSNSRDQAMRKRKGKGNMLPRLEGKTEKLRNRFDLELKMKEKYDKEYFFEDGFEFFILLKIFFFNNEYNVFLRIKMKNRIQLRYFSANLFE